MDLIFIILGFAYLYLHIVGIHASGKNQESKGSTYLQGVLMGIFIPYYSLYCWYKYRSYSN
jgi:hypothetical protein